MDFSRAKQIVEAHYVRALKRYGDMNSPRAVGQFLCARYAGLEYEVFTVLFVDAQNQLIEAVDMFRGTLTQTSVYPREVIKEALRRNAAGVVLAHNHPSGISQPSRADEQVTQSLKEALGLVDIRVIDHFVVAGPDDFVSMASLGLL